MHQPTPLSAVPARRTRQNAAFRAGLSAAGRTGARGRTACLRTAVRAGRSSGAMTITHRAWCPAIPRAYHPARNRRPAIPLPLRGGGPGSGCTSQFLGFAPEKRLDRRQCTRRDPSGPTIPAGRCVTPIASSRYFCISLYCPVKRARFSLLITTRRNLRLGYRSHSCTKNRVLQTHDTHPRLIACPK